MPGGILDTFHGSSSTVDRGPRDTARPGTPAPAEDSWA